MRWLLPLLVIALGACPAPSASLASDESPALVVPAHVALAYAVVGETPRGTLTLRNASTQSLSLRVEVTGPFQVEGDRSPLPAGEERALVISWTGASTAPALSTGVATITADGEQHRVSLAAVIGGAGLPPTRWSEDSTGRWTVTALPSAPFQPDGPGPWHDPSVLIWVPRGLSRVGPLRGITHLHGHNTTLADGATTQPLIKLAAAAGRDAVLVIPQGPHDARSGDFGQLAAPGGHLALLTDTLALLYRDGLYADALLGQQVLTAHSGGYSAAADILRGGDVPVVAVHLFDALYGRADTFRDFAVGGGRLRSAYTASGGTVSQNRSLALALTDDGLAVSADFSEPSLRGSQVSIGPSEASHVGVLLHHGNYARWLRASGLP